jgi:hypothetical protein
MFRRLFPYPLLAGIGVVGMVFWQKSSLSELEDIKVSSSRHSLSVTSPRLGTLPVARLRFLTDLSQPYQVRINLLRSTLAEGCSEPELRYLYVLLDKGANKSEIPEHGYVVANDLMTQLLIHETDPKRFAENFTALLNNTQQPEVIRDYAVQFLATWLNPRSALATPSALASPPPEIAAQVLDSIVTAATSPALSQTSVPGTTLMMLVDLTRSGSGVDCRSAVRMLKPWLAQALGEGSTLSLAVRVSAVTAAGILAPEEFRPTLRKIAFRTDGSAALQLPALASLGQSGEAADLPRLQEVAATQPALAYAAAEAGRVLTTRLADNSPTISR